MRAISIASLCVFFLPATTIAHVEGVVDGFPHPHIPFPWPIHHLTATTTVAPSAVSAFDSGIAEALGITQVETCIKETNSSASDLWAATKDYMRKKNVISKAEALVKIGKAIEHVIDALGPCSKSITDAEKYKKLVANVKDPRFYTPHNAFTLFLNAVEDHSQLEAFVTAWEKDDWHKAGFEIMSAILDILEHNDIPRSNSSAAVDIAIGITEGLSLHADFKCFKDVRVEIPALVGGVMDVLGMVDIVGGLESIFHGLTGLVPTYKECMAEKPKIMEILREVSDFAHPKELAEKLGHNIMDNKLDLSLDLATLLLDFKTKEWERFGQDMGKMLDKIILGNATSSVLLV